ncbi:MAG: ABC transporter ATP-binding protein [Anaerolineaceae bacterium]|nr:ABC transporter ATP-binding protein [Anaerolineaceae bacterium]
MLQLRHVCKRFGNSQVLDDVSLEVQAGEIVCLLGPSGCGKTTLLRIIAGLEAPDHGEICLQGVDFEDVPVHERNFGLMFQDYALFPHMTVAQNVAFGLRMRRQDSVAQRTSDTLSLVGMKDMGQRDVSSLSGGEQQRVALARSLAPRPSLLMLDEPLASLDAGLRERLLPELRQIFVETGQTVITVTHDQQEASAIADRIAIMNARRIEQYDTPQALYARPRNAFVAEFLGLGSPVRGEWLAAQAAETFNGEHLLLHPAGMRLANSAEDSALVLDGTLVQRSYEGENWRLTVRVAGEAFRFRHPLDACPVPEPGTKVWLRIERDWILRLE